MDDGSRGRISAPIPNPPRAPSLWQSWNETVGLGLVLVVFAVVMGMA